MTDLERPIAGYEAKTYYDSAGNTATPTWVELKNVQNCNEPSDMTEVEVNSRASKRKRFIAGLESAPLEFDYLYVQGGTDAKFNFLIAKYRNRQPIHMAVADGNIATDGTYYIRDWYQITKAEKKGELEGAVVYSFRAVPTIHLTAGAIDEYSAVLVGGTTTTTPAP